MQLFILICNRLAKFIGNLSKIFLSYPFHFIFPKKRFSIPEKSRAIFKGKNQIIPKQIWQTNYTNRVSLPVYLNYLFNRLLSLDYDYFYISTQNRLEFIKNNTEKDIIEAYEKLNDGAAQADFWRLNVLNIMGGVYLDIDAHLVFPLAKIIKKNDTELFIYKKNLHTNYFLAAKANHIILKKSIQNIKNNINQNQAVSVFSLTGPVPFDEAIKKKKLTFNAKSYRLVCVQGSFTNEYFQYIDKPNGKWTHKKTSEILKQKRQMQAIFLDRDGVINEEKGYLHKIADFKFINGVFAACRNFQKLGFQIIIITNQSGIAKGFYDENDFDIVNNWVLAEFKKNRVNILDVFFCPHAPDDNCNCRKPKPGMLLQAQAKHNIAMNKSWMIGDKEADIQAANAAGITNTILVRSGHKINEANSNATHIIDSLKDYSDIF